MERKKEDNFIHQMLEETYSFIPESDTSKGSEDLYKHFSSQTNSEKDTEKSLLDFVKELSLHFLPLKWRDSTGCYRLEVYGKKIDIPSNWGPFSNFNAEDSSFIHIDDVCDQVGLLNIFSSLVGQEVEILVVTAPNNKMYMGLIDRAKQESLSELLSTMKESYSLGAQKRSA